MSLILVNPPTLYNVRDARLEGRSSYLELVMKHAGSPANHQTLPAEHLGLLSIKAWCASKGMPAHVVNGVTALHRSVAETLASIQAVVLREGRPELIGFTGPSLVFEENLWLAAECKRLWPEARTIFGHDFATLNAERLLLAHPEIDFVCIGEGELVYCELARRLLNARPFDDVPGLAQRISGGAVRVRAPEALDLRQLPWPSRDDLGPVLRLGLSAAVYTSRGCPYRCSFCTTGQTAAMLGRQSYRLREIDDVIDEIEMLRKGHGVEHVTITDDLFLTKSALSRERAERFASELIRRQVHVTFMIDCRVDSIERSLFRMLHRAGLRRVFVGVETGSEEQLDAYNKRYRGCGGDTLRRLDLLHELGIGIIPGILTYHPAIAPPELRATLQMIEACDYDGMYQFLNRVKPYPGTPLHEEYRRNGWLTREWPVADWEFQETQARVLFDAVLATTSRPGSSFAEVKAVFEQHLETWEAESCTPSPR